jgi:hypothetical protein
MPSGTIQRSSDELVVSWINPRSGESQLGAIDEGTVKRFRLASCGWRTRYRFKGE